MGRVQVLTGTFLGTLLAGPIEVARNPTFSASSRQGPPCCVSLSSTQSPGPIRTGHFATRRQKGPDRLARLPPRRRWRTAAIRSCRCWARPRSSLRISRLIPRIGYIVGCGRSGVLPMHENGGGRCHIGRCRGRPAARTHHKPLLERATRRAHCSFGPRSTGILRGPPVGRTTRAPHEHVSQTRPVTKDSDRRP